MKSHYSLIFFASLLVMLSACSGTKTNSETKAPQMDSLGDSYTNAQYDISLRMPEEWILLEEPNLNEAMGTFAINLFKRGTGAEQETPLHVHAEVKHSYVAIWPHGYGTELPASQDVSFNEVNNLPNFKFSINEEKSKILQLKDGSTWAYFIVLQNPPEEWEEYGFIFAQISTINNSSTCYDGTTCAQIPLDRCDYLAGDRYIREADVNQQDAKTIRNILESISLENIREKTKATDLIKIEKPLPNIDVTSPLIVKGKARGQWYFEGNFSVELQDAAGNILAEKAVQAQGKWMTEDFVPFEVTLEFEAPDDERGQLIFHRANPSGLEENAMKYTLPVIFPPK